MNKDLDFRIYLLINLKKLTIIVFDSSNQNLYEEKIEIKNTEISDHFDLLRIFLKKNIFKIEKKLQRFINNVYIILENDDFFSIRSSIKYKSENKKFHVSGLNNLLFDLKNELIKTINENDIVHIKIDKFLINDKEHQFLPDELIFNDICTEVRFICLPKKIVKTIEKILSEYQITVNKIFSYNYLNSSKSSQNDSIIKIAEDVLNRVNPNEVFLVNKNQKKQGFFEKFFDFFS